MKKLVKNTAVIFAACSALAVMLLLGSCGQQAQPTLQDIASDNPEVVKIIEGALTTPEPMTSEVSFSGDSFDITYRFKDKIDDADEKELVKAFDENADVLKKGFEQAIADLESQTGITGITGTIHIFNASGDETWTHEYPEKE